MLSLKSSPSATTGSSAVAQPTQTTGRLQSEDPFALVVRLLRSLSAAAVPPALSSETRLAVVLFVGAQQVWAVRGVQPEGQPALFRSVQSLAHASPYAAFTWLSLRVPRPPCAMVARKQEASPLVATCCVFASPVRVLPLLRLCAPSSISWLTCVMSALDALCSTVGVLEHELLPTLPLCSKAVHVHAVPPALGASQKAG